jgi:hypothetical protein
LVDQKEWQKAATRGNLTELGKVEMKENIVAVRWVLMKEI